MESKFKFCVPPMRSGLVSRSGLIARLDAGIDRKLTLVSAPAGFGKTTLLGEWVQHTKQPVAWLSLDKNDNSLVQFWRHVITAIQMVEDSIGETALAAVNSSPPPSAKSLVTILVNDISSTVPSLSLVLDDYHAIEAQPIHESLDFLLDCLPPQLHLTVSTRADPPLCLSRRRARAEMVEIRAEHLRFTTQETIELLNAHMGLDLSIEDVTLLNDRTEGWIVGLQMAALSLQGRVDKHDFVATFAGNDRYIVDYLVEEVLRRQPDHVQTFLLETSVLERLCDSLCEAVTGRNDSRATLRYLEQANLFVVPLDNRRHWYRYHHLFGDLLREHLGHSEEAGDLAALHLRASAWYEQEGAIPEAVSHAMAVPDFERVADLIERYALDLFHRSEIPLLHSRSRHVPASGRAAFVASSGFNRLDAAVRVVNQLGDFHAAFVADSSRKGAVVIEKIPLALKLDDGVVRRPPDNRLEDIPSENKWPARVTLPVA